jgi:monofunctional biosynthetic peptidoglycan transglycosylase
VPRRRSALRRALRALALLLALAAGALALPFLVTPSVGTLARANPGTTALLEQRRTEARTEGRPFRPRMSWVPLDRVSERLVEAVLLSEDAGFFVHGGFDWHELREAAAESLRRGRLGRGASTLTQQLAKNLWLGPERSLWRKAREAALTLKLEHSLGKRRILALYLNVVEWGDGVFGVEAAAHSWFGVPASRLSTAQAVVLASMLPAPRRASLEAPPRWLQHRSRRLLDRMEAAGRIDAEEHAHAAAELERILAGPGGDQAEEPPEEGASEEREPPAPTATVTPTASSPEPRPQPANRPPTATAAPTATPPGPEREPEIPPP